VAEHRSRPGLSRNGYGQQTDQQSREYCHFLTISHAVDRESASSADIRTRPGRRP
jgi:hypothetical protein